MTWVTVTTNTTVVWSYGRHVAVPRRAIEDSDQYGQAGATAGSKLTKAFRQHDAQLKASTLPCRMLVSDIDIAKL